MTHDLQELPEFCCLGLEAEGALCESRAWIPALWGAFWRRRAEIGIEQQCAVWGLMSDAEVHLAPWGGERGRYFAGLQVPVGTEPSGDWKVWTIPAMTWMRIPCRMDRIPDCIEFAKGFQRNHPEFRWAGAVHEFYPANFRNPAMDELHLMAGLLPR